MRNLAAINGSVNAEPRLELLLLLRLELLLELDRLELLLELDRLELLDLGGTTTVTLPLHCVSVKSPQFIAVAQKGNR
jgi:hypothetical protein